MKESAGGIIKTTIKLSSIKASGHHGANPGEQDSPQDFTVDLKVKLDVATDELSQTADYEELAAIAKRQVENNSYKLLETLAYNIASEINTLEKVAEVSVTVHKPSAAKMLGAGDVVAKVKLGKDEQ